MKLKDLINDITTSKKGVSREWYKNKGKKQYRISDKELSANNFPSKKKAEKGLKDGKEIFKKYKAGIKKSEEKNET